MTHFGVLFQIALRNLFASFLNVIIGMLILGGTLFIVVGGALLDSLDGAMSKSIIGSVSGDLQVYSARSKEDLALFGNVGGFPDVAPIEDFGKLRDSLLKVPNVKAVVPMGINGALVTSGNTIDLTLEKLRDAEKARLAGGGPPDLGARIDALKQHVRHIVSVLRGNLKNADALTSEVDPAMVETLQKAGADEFWAGFDADPLGHLEFLENRVASLIPDADMRFVSYIGTDLKAFQGSFDRMEIVDGQPVPQGQRGFLMAKFRYEEDFKLKTARRLDKLDEALREKGKHLATDPDLQQLVTENRNQTRELILQLDPLTAAQATARLQGLLHTEETDLAKLFASFFTTTDDNFAERYRFFYAQIAPLVELYRIRPGDNLTIKAFTNSGYVQSINVKVYGTFNFKGLEKSSLAGALSLMDLGSFRDLYGYMTPDKLAELKQLQSHAGAKMVDRDRAEADLFGDTHALVDEKKMGAIDDAAELRDAKQAAKATEAPKPFTQDEIDHGVVLNAAVMLKDPSLLQQTMPAIVAQAKSDGIEVKTMSWQQAAGFIGQFVLVAKLVLFLAVAFIFIVTLVVINNAVMMATMQRVTEIGTMRAIGAQRPFVLMMILVETVVLGLVFGGVGAALGSGVMWALHAKGIPAVSDWLYFFFSGPRLFPGLHASNLVWAFVIVLIVTCISTLYPAILATRVSPVQAMQTDE